MSAGKRKLRKRTWNLQLRQYCCACKLLLLHCLRIWETHASGPSSSERRTVLLTCTLVATLSVEAGNNGTSESDIHSTWRALLPTCAALGTRRQGRVLKRTGTWTLQGPGGAVASSVNVARGQAVRQDSNQQGFGSMRLGECTRHRRPYTKGSLAMNCGNWSRGKNFAVDAVTRYLVIEDAKVREVAVQCLAKVAPKGDDRVIRALAARKGDTSFPVRVRVMQV